MYVNIYKSKKRNKVWFHLEFLLSLSFCLMADWDAGLLFYFYFYPLRSSLWCISTFLVTWKSVFPSTFTLCITVVHWLQVPTVAFILVFGLLPYANDNGIFFMMPARFTTYKEINMKRKYNLKSVLRYQWRESISHDHCCVPLCSNLRR